MTFSKGSLILVDYTSKVKDTGEVFETTAQTPSELYSELQAKNGFSIDQDALRVAINGDFAEFDVSLSKGDEVVFIPPVAGG